jgi:hypothetical protein
MLGLPGNDQKFTISLQMRDDRVYAPYNFNPAPIMRPTLRCARART